MVGDLLPALVKGSKEGRPPLFFKGEGDIRGEVDK